MKKYIYLLIMALIVISCEETDELQNDPTGTSHVLNAKITKAESRAVWDTQPLSWDGSDMANSRTYAKPEGDGKDFYNQYWSVGDAISYFSTTFNSKYVSTKTNKNTDEYITYFEQVSTGEGEPLDTGYNYGVYPYKEDTKIATDGTVTFTFPENQVYCEDSYANGANGMIGRHTDEEQVLEFLNFCSYLQLKLTSNVDKDIDKIVLKANNVQDLMSGVGTITFDSIGYPKVTMDHEKSINHLVLNCRNQEIRLDSINATKFWFVLPGGFTFTKGFNITVAFTDGTYFKKSTNSNVGIITIERNHIKPLATLPLDEQNLLSSTIRYKYNTNTNPGKEAFEFLEDVTFFKDENGNVLKPYTQYNDSTGEYEITFDGHLYSIEKNAFDTTRAPDMDYIIVDNSTAIDVKNFAFWNCSADSIIINNDIITLDQKAFSESWATKIVINGDIHKIEEDAFNLCYDLETIKINGDIEHIETNGFSSTVDSIFISGRVTNIGEKAFAYCYNLEYISMPMVEHIETNAFLSCTSLKKLDLHGVHRIGAAAFQGCRNLEEICISKDCLEIEEGAFSKLTKLKVVKLYATTPPKLIHRTGQDNPYVFEFTTKIHIPQESLNEYLKDADWKYYYDEGCLVADITPEEIQEHFGENAHENL